MIRKNKLYCYHVAFFHSKGFGSISMLRQYKILTIENVEEVKKYITKEMNVENVVILNWIKLRKSNRY